MEITRERRSKETSPDRARVNYVGPKTKAFRKVQIIYYLSRNGQLEHPHFMEISHLTNQHIRLKDVMDRLSLLRGKAVTTLYSWSCKRTYKNGYVWNDLAENDVMYPTEGVEYVLKGSEIAQSSCTDNFQQLNLTTPSRRVAKSPPLSRKCNINHHNPKAEEVDMEDTDDDDEEEEEEAEVEPKTKNHSGSIDKIHRHPQEQQQASELHLGEVINISPSSSSSSEKTNHTVIIRDTNENNNNTIVPTIDRERTQAKKHPSVLLQLIACGSVAVKGGSNKAAMLMKTSFSPPRPSLLPLLLVWDTTIQTVISERKSFPLSRVAAASHIEEGDEEDVIKYMSENPRFGNPQMEDKEYFSGSIVESMSMATEKRATEVVSEPSFKRSSSYNEERNRKCVIEENEVEKIKETTVKTKCMPGRKRSTSRLQQQSKH